MNEPEMYTEYGLYFFLKPTILKKIFLINKLDGKYYFEKNIIWELSYVYEKQCSEVFHELLV